MHPHPCGSTRYGVALDWEIAMGTGGRGLVKGGSNGDGEGVWSDGRDIVAWKLLLAMVCKWMRRGSGVDCFDMGRVCSCVCMDGRHVYGWTGYLAVQQHGRGGCRCRG
jgi:hypothetical protein